MIRKTIAALALVLLGAWFTLHTFAQRNVAPEKLFTPAQSATALLQVIAAAGPDRSGEHIAWDGQTIPG